MDATAGRADRRSVSFPGGAALAGDDGMWVLADADYPTGSARSLAPALVVAMRTGDRALNLVVDADEVVAGGERVAGLLARRAGQFARPPRVWVVDDRSLEPAQPAPLPQPSPLDPRVGPFADVLAAAGADPVVEHGRLIGEVAGLEVARVVVDEDGPHLEVGVGRFDREAHAIVSDDQPSEATLRRVVELVRRHRRLDAEPHPLNRLVASRWLRSRIVAEPSLVGADHLTPVSPTVEAPDLRTPWPAPAAGIDTDGEPVVVVCSVGVDLDLVPAAADARLAAFPYTPGPRAIGARLVLAMPPRDVHPVTETLAGALAEPAAVVAVRQDQSNE